MARENIPADALAMLLINTIFKLLPLNDSLWANFGFKARPKVGSLFDRFRSREKVALERFLLDEFMLLGVIEALCVVYTRIDVGYTNSIFNKILLGVVDDGGTGDDLKIWRTGFATRDEAIDYYHTGVISYLNIQAADESNEAAQKSILFRNRARQRAINEVDKFIVGSVFLFSNQLPDFRSILDRFVSGYQVTQGATVIDNSFIDTSNEIGKILQRQTKKPK